MSVEINNKDKMPKLYLRGLEHGVKIGAVSVASLQKTLNVNRQAACNALLWMIEHGFVKDEGGRDDLKMVLLRENEFNQMMQERGISLKTKRERQRTVDDALYKICLRFAIRRGTVTVQSLMDELAIGRIRAEAVVGKMRRENLLEDDFCRWKMLMTKEKFKELYGEDV